MHVPVNNKPSKKDLTIVPESIILKEVKDEPSSEPLKTVLETEKEQPTTEVSTPKRSYKDESGTSSKPTRARRNSRKSDQ